MQFDFISRDGQRIQYDIGNNVLCHSDIASMADEYAKLHPDKLPTHIWIKAGIYKDYALQHRGDTFAYEDGMPCLVVLTGCGFLFVKPLPYNFSKFNLLVGTKDDYNNYFIDEVFEETVLDGCDRE